MTSYEKADAKRTSQVIRSSRKLAGRSQKSLAESLGVSQGCVSKLESGLLIPSVSMWFHLCQEFGLDSEHAFKTGLIDRCTSATNNSAAGNGSFRIPKKYTRHSGSKVRTTQPFLNFFEARLSQSKLLDYLAFIRIDPDFLVILDQQLNIRFSLDLVCTLIEKGYLHRCDIGRIARPLSAPEAHGRMERYYRGIRSRKSLLLQLIANIDRYESNFHYEVVDESEEKLTLAVVPSQILKQFKFKIDMLGSFMCEYKIHYIKSFSTYAGGPPIFLREIECLFAKGKRCLYEINFSSKKLQ